jgi:rare lipoprotein A
MIACAPSTAQRDPTLVAAVVPAPAVRPPAPPLPNPTLPPVAPREAAATPVPPPAAALEVALLPPEPTGPRAPNPRPSRPPEPLPAVVAPPSVPSGALVGAALPPPRPMPPAPAPLPLPGAEVVEGLASWYGPGFEGRNTASGEPFDSGQLTAAHRSLPFGTVVEVTNLANGASVLVRINDRGPFEPMRIIDLSQAAADAIGMLSAGVASVSIVPLTTGVDALKLAVAADLRGFEARSSRFSPGQLLVLEGGDEPLLVRVVAGEAGFGADLFVSAEVFEALGPITQARRP